ncbi:DUF805 domain-containing protein [Siculibacillus lacustris]|uniref:DUF805 domain-containing protein n=1 Tax=Siculibacillus lacustris TaxID=1549641 RepID=A0A4Q9VT87_9HYPH|nr:DUF805 domain-containing protein [Siculibacillus lacustris]TBW39272.1 DUF805 domain-containing protein [Siculibacillus lacustris]
MPFSSWFSFSGRSGRLAFWGIGLVQMVFLIGLGVGLGLVAGAAAGGTEAGGLTEAPLPIVAIWGLGLLLVVWTGLAATTRRWHDRGKSGWWTLLQLVPVIGPLWIFVELGFLPGTPDVNRFGPPPGSGGDGGATDRDAELDRAVEKWRSGAAASQDLPAGASARRDPWAAPSAGSAPPRAAAGGFGRRGLT